jgi:hypothetical protein
MTGSRSRQWAPWLAAALGLLTAETARAQSCGTIPKVLIVLDRSASMKETVNGSSKWQTAREAVADLAEGFSGQLALGLMLYPRFPDLDACTPGTTTVKPATGSKGALVAALNKAYPKGGTPLVATLDAARAALGKSGPRHVILVSDGKETCLVPAASPASSKSCSWNQGTNYRKCSGCGWQFCLSDGTWSKSCQPRPEVHPCPGGQTCGSDALCSGTITGSVDLSGAAKMLAGAQITIHVVGFGAKVDAAALNAIAQIGGTSSYHKATSLSQLKAAFQTIAGAISCCGNGQLDAGETCDTAIPSGQAGACSTACDDGDPCTVDSLSGAACSTACSSQAVTKALSGDGCCPVGATASSDSDCTTCGDGVLGKGETCDPGIPAGQPGACYSCDDGNPCTVDTAAGDACNPGCTYRPVDADPLAKDGCCPPQATSAVDPDCPPPCGGAETKGCVDTCQWVSCGDGERCVAGQCVPWGGGEAGCDCDAGRGRGGGAAGALGLVWLLPLALWVLRRGRLAAQTRDRKLARPILWMLLAGALVAAGCSGDGGQTPRDSGALDAVTGADLTPDGPSGTYQLLILRTNDLHSNVDGTSPNADYTPGSTNDDATLGGSRGWPPRSRTRGPAPAPRRCCCWTRETS